MAGVAGDLAMSVEIVLVDGHHHRHHLARDQLWLLIILIKMILNVTETTLHSQRRGYELHGRNQLVRRNVLQYLNILESLPSSYRCALGSWRAGCLSCQR